MPRSTILVGLLCCAALLPLAAAKPEETRLASGAEAPAYAWSPAPHAQPLDQHIPPPDGFVRVNLTAGTFGAWLRQLPTKPPASLVHLFDGRLKANQAVHAAVLDIDVGNRDLQQCADAAIRLRAEYLWSSGKKEAICFHFTSGHLVAWQDWATGLRPLVDGRHVVFKTRAAADAGYANFRRYLDALFMYAGTRSLKKELKPVPVQDPISPGDVFIQAGSPGHAVIVLDAAFHPRTQQRVVLLGQSFMPAQEIHVLKVLGPTSPWLPDDAGGATNRTIETPEWRFTRSDLRRFEAAASCRAQP
ncbi:MAG: DUF4846 domain-containing protein [Deltaproteobacteria bacterium]|nr:DUF4846 domain-containing protein [Deltaproteobacteria bacterium]